jgi:hypothetical protein
MFRRILLFTLILMTINLVPATAQDDCPPTQFTEWRSIAVVTPGDANNLRAEPSATAELVGRVPPAEPFEIIPQSAVCADGFLWREIETFTLRGWTVEIAADGGDPFIVPYVAPDPREVSVQQEDGSLLVQDSGLRMVLPAGLAMARVMVQPQVGLFGSSMSAQPSSIVYFFEDQAGDYQNVSPYWSSQIEIFPYAQSATAASYWEDNVLNTLLIEQPELTQDAVRDSLPQTPIGGSGALFRGAPRYLPFADGNGVRYVTYFAQTSVLFATGRDRFQYLYRGISADRSFFITAQFSVTIPDNAIPANGSRDDDGYPAYLAQLERNLDAQPTSAFTPDLALYDALIASLTITDAQALYALIP